MKPLLRQLKWQFIVLHKNSIITISFAVTLIYGIISYLIRGVGSLDMILITLVLNDPSIIGYFFIALAIYMEQKHRILAAIFTTPINIHHYLISKTIALSVIGLVCSLGLAFFVKGGDFQFFEYTVGTTGMCLLSAFLGIIVLTFTDDFMRFAILSIPFFIFFIILPLLHYLGAIDLGSFQYLFPIQGCIQLIEYAISGTAMNPFFAYGSILFWGPIFYFTAYRLFRQKIANTAL